VSPARSWFSAASGGCRPIRRESPRDSGAIGNVLAAPAVRWDAIHYLGIVQHGHSTAPATGQPLQSLDRYTLTMFPLWMAAGVWVAERRLSRIMVLASAALLVFSTFQFATWAWVA
jgi:hypothetical protein